ncbi:replication initiation protein [Enterococcus faecalis]|jgi:plasmid replication initiation protein|nr:MULTISPECIES: replication initiation protein [Bacteria]MBS7181796.1 replication initiation protein [Enterococcus gallinarum]MDU2252610.1 replication initiation protein [Veillonella parvula]MDU5020181.1 replication initiation protein [Clostridiales bacterium]MVH71801.1 RepB family plasmid replication initiator protein [Staphylococcus aureus]HEF7651415.1 replication initiation protein [Campylobacter jejuni]
MKKDTELTVKYRNELNMITLKKFNAKEMDLFFALCARMKDKGLNNIVFSFEELKELSDYRTTAIKAFTDDLDSLYSKMLQLTYRDEYDDDGSFRRFVLFTSFDVNVKKQTVEVSINPKLEGILNGLTTEFSKFELSAFTSLRSTYAKTLFRLLMQYRSTGYYVVNIEEFRELLNIPDYYQMGNIDQKVLKPAMKELNNYFEDLEITKIKAKKGNKIAKLEFTFTGLKTTKPSVTMHDWVNGE